MPYYSQKICQLIVVFDTGKFRLRIQQSLPYLTPIQLVIVQLSFCCFEQSQLKTVMFTEKVKIMDVSFDKI